MTLLHPIMLSFLGFIPLLIIIHMLRVKQRTIPISNLFLWQNSIKQAKIHFLLRILKLPLSLLMQIIIIILVSFALAKPVWYSPKSFSGTMILIMDVSASMKTLKSPKNKTTRFDEAKQRALELIKTKTKNSRVLIITAGHTSNILIPFTKNSQILIDTIRTLQATDTPADLLQAIYLSLSFVTQSERDKIFCITDKIDSASIQLINSHPSIEPIIIEGGKKNVGITQFAFRQKQDNSDNYAIMVEIQNFNPTTTLCPLQLKVDSTMIMEKTFTLNAFEKQLHIIPYKGILSGIASAIIQTEDDFSIDDTVYSILSASQALKILLVSPGNFFLKTLLQTYPNCWVDTLITIDPFVWNEMITPYDIVIIDRVPFPPTKKGNLFVIDAICPSLPFRKSGSIKNPQITDWNRNHPVTANINLRDIAIFNASHITSMGNTKSLISSSDRNLLYQYKTESINVLFLCFNILKSNLPLRIAFPVLMSNIINYLNPNTLHFSTNQVKTGQPYIIHNKSQTSSFSIKVPFF